ncbi:MAG: DNA polymerase III [Treponema sp.]|jgi:DNA polymerase-3 subunit gamma/tau|nr:DNA polymerase III [Treponema sp.]
MFENIIAQAATAQLKTDILSRKLVPSMLFFGPAASGKGSSAIELARTLSCQTGAAAWNCACSDCARHRAMIHPDVAIIGPRNFAAEIAASRSAFFRDPASAAGRSLFIRSLRKLLARFAPAVWEYESKSGRTNPLSILQSLEEEIDEFESLASGENVHENYASLEKCTDSLLKNAFKLEDDCMSETIPIAQIRKAAWWSRLSPLGKRKTLIIENADHMKDEARNSLLKLLEEPPESITIVLTAIRRESLLQTILSRLRPYRFLARSADEEREIIRRIFRDTANNADSGVAGLVASYLDSFLPQSTEKLLPMAAFFVAAVARAAAIAAKSYAKNQSDISPALKALGSYCAPIAEAAGFDRISEAKDVIAALLSRSVNFEGRSFPRFLSLSLDLVSWSLKEYALDHARIACSDIWRKHLGESQAAFGIWNQRPELALESLFNKLREDMAAL